MAGAPAEHIQILFDEIHLERHLYKTAMEYEKIINRQSVSLLYEGYTLLRHQSKSRNFPFKFSIEVQPK